MTRRTAGWIVDRHPEWGDALAEYVRAQLAAVPEEESARIELQTRLARLARSSVIQEILATAVRDSEAAADARLLALRVMAAANLKETPGSWPAAIAALLSNESASLFPSAIATARVLPLPKDGHAPLASALAGIGRNSQHATAHRLNALAALPATLLPPIDAELFSFLCAHLASTHPTHTRSSAAAILAKASLTSEQQLALAEALKSANALDVPKLLPAFEKNPSEALGLKLVAVLKQSPGLPGIRAHVLKPLLAKYPSTVQRAGDALLASLNTDTMTQNARIDQLLATFGTGDIRRGQAVFNSEKTACTVCHVIGYHGGRHGPDLTTIGKIRTARELLEAIVFPSATFVRGFEPFVATTKSGESHGGLLRKDADDEVVLATGPEAEQRIARSDLTDLQPGNVSPMPPGMDAILTPQELADLVVFLKSRQ